MLLKIYKVLFSSLFAFSYIFSMNPLAKVHEHVQIEVPISQVITVQDQGSMPDNSHVVILQPNGQTHCYVSLSSNTQALPASVQSQLPSQMIEGRHLQQDMQGAQHMFNVIVKSNRAMVVDAVVANIKAALSSNAEKLAAKNVQGLCFSEARIAEYMKDHASASCDQFRSLKGQLSETCRQLENELHSLMERNYHVELFINAEQKFAESSHSIRNDVKKTMSVQDLGELNRALELQGKIKLIKGDMQACDKLIRTGEQAIYDFKKQVASANVQELEQVQNYWKEQENIYAGYLFKKERDIYAIQATLRRVESDLCDKNSKFIRNQLEVQKQAAQADLKQAIAQRDALYAQHKQACENSVYVQKIMAEKQAIQAQVMQDQEAGLVQDQQDQELQPVANVSASQDQEALIFYSEQGQSQYESLDFDWANCPDVVLENQYTQRQQALFQTKDHHFVAFDQEFYLSSQAAAYLQMHGINYTQLHKFHGTALQQQLHSEYCTIVEQAAEKQAQLCYQSDWLKQCVVCADAAYDANQLEQIQMVVSLNNVGFTLLEYGQAVETGVVLGVKAALHNLTNPRQAVESVAKAAYYVLESAALNNYSEEDGFGEVYIPLRDQRNEQISAGLKTLGHVILSSTGPQRVQALTQFAVDFGVSGKIMKVVGGIMGVAESAAVQRASVIPAQTQVSNINQIVASIVDKTLAARKLGTHIANHAQTQTARIKQVLARIANKGLESHQVETEVARALRKAKTAIEQENIAQHIAKDLMHAEKQLDKAAKSIAGHSSEAINQFKHGLADLLKDTVPGELTSGRAKQYEKLVGDYGEAIKDFHGLKPSNISNIPGREGLHGILPDGRNINVRIGSKDGRPTLEIMKPGGVGTRIKIRYGTKNM
jgi:hypothetical protein